MQEPSTKFPSLLCNVQLASSRRFNFASSARISSLTSIWFENFSSCPDRLKDLTSSWHPHNHFFVRHISELLTSDITRFCLSHFRSISLTCKSNHFNIFKISNLIHHFQNARRFQRGAIQIPHQLHPLEQQWQSKLCVHLIECHINPSRLTLEKWPKNVRLSAKVQRKSTNT
jgi:hypothetical protein